MIRLIESKASAGERFSIALSGGNTPRGLYVTLATNYRDRSCWSSVDFFFGDERYVPGSDPRSNFHTAQESLFDPLAIPAAQIHPMPTGIEPPERAASEYEKNLRSQFLSPWPCFNLVLLGMGPEGHTASLFPGSPALEEESQWVVPATVPAEPPVRLTLTPRALAEAANVWFLVTGAEKAPAVRDALSNASHPLNPAGMIRPAHGSLVWWLDEAAASQL